jgi:ribosomal protein S6--L-glutamate ligase
VFAQREVPSAGRDLKVYVVGDQMWAITRPFPARTLADKLGAPARVPPGIREAAVACGRALGLELYGVDFLVAGDEFFAVDVNAFPGYKGVPDAPRAVAEHLHGRLNGAAV